MGILLLLIILAAYLVGWHQKRQEVREITVVVLMDKGEGRPARLTQTVDYTVMVLLPRREIGPIRGSTRTGRIRIPLPKQMSAHDALVNVNLKVSGDCCMDRDGPAAPAERPGEYQVALFCFRDCTQHGP